MSTTSATHATDTAVILAAGWGSRMQGLAEANEPVSKPLIPLGGRPMVVRVIQTLAAAGVTRFVIVTGYLHERVEATVQALATETGLEIRTVFNPEWDTLANGVSALVARESVEGPFILSMADHAFDLAIVQQLQAEGPRQMGVRLCVDRKIAEVFDIDDATKVVTQGDRIVAIDKKLKDYNAIDIGLFICLPELFDALATVKDAKGDCSLSDGMRRLGDAGRFGFMDIGKYLWQDADTPETLAYAERLLNEGKLNFLK
jgi:choline kinase